MVRLQQPCLPEIWDCSYFIENLVLLHLRLTADLHPEKTRNKQTNYINLPEFNIHSGNKIFQNENKNINRY
jgi:hypothetical protein